MTFDIEAKKNENEKQASFQRNKNVDESKNRQKSKQILMKKFKNRKNIFKVITMTLSRRRTIMSITLNSSSKKK